MKNIQDITAGLPNFVTGTTDNSKGRSSMSEIVKIRFTFTSTAFKDFAQGVLPHTSDFNARGNSIRIAIDYGDDHIQITENTCAFDNATTGYLGRLSSVTVRTAAHPEKRAQDKTTVRKSECIVHSDGLSLSQTAQPDNALAAATTYSRDLHRCLLQIEPNERTTHFNYHPFGLVTGESRLDGTRTATEDVCDDSQSVTNPRNELNATSKYRVTNTGSAAPSFTIWYDRFGRAIRARTVGFDDQTVYQDIGYDKVGQDDYVAENDSAAKSPTHWTKTTFNKPGHVDAVTITDGTRAKTTHNGREATKIRNYQRNF